MNRARAIVMSVIAASATSAPMATAMATAMVTAMVAAPAPARAKETVVADLSSSEVKQLLAAVDGPDENARARAARRLFELRDPHALEANLKTLDDAPDPLHLDYTPSVHALVALGRPALAPLYDRMAAPAELTRRRAMNAVAGITQRLFGRDVMRGWPSGAESRWFVWWSALGYRPDGDDAPAVDARKHAIARLRAWRAP
jgi:hypothetical protein